MHPISSRPAALGLVFAIFSIVALAGSTHAAGADVTSAALRGQALYRGGVHADGRPLTAVTVGTGIPLPASFVACVNCHGHDARGKTEGGVSSSDLRWDTLTKPYGFTRPDGRRRAPYDAALFFAAITQGIDSSGHSLNPTMPRYQMSVEEAAEVLSYLGRTESSTESEGVTDNIIRIGLVGFNQAVVAGGATTDRALLAAWCADVNRRGIFRRQIELVEIDSPASDSAPPVLAVLVSDHAPPLSGSGTWRIPSLRVTAERCEKNNRYEFSLFPGVVERVQALISYAAAEDPSASSTSAVLLYPAKGTAQTLLDAIAAAMPSLWLRPAPLETDTADDLVRALHEAGVEWVVLLGEENAFAEVISSAARLSWNPLFLFPESSELTTAVRRSVTVQDMLAADLSGEALAIYNRCAARNSSNEQGRLRQFGLLASAQVLLLGLENSGREINREKLVDTLAALGEFRTGFARPGGFSSNRRTAAAGIYLVPRATLVSRPQPVWVELDRS